MTTPVEAIQSIYSQFETDWDDTLPFTYKNEAFDAEDEWVRLTVEELAAEQDTLGATGNRKFKRFAVVFIEVFVLPDEGVLTALGYATTIRTIFEGKTIEGLIFHAVHIRPGKEDGRWFRLVVEAEFYYHETK